MSSNPTYFITGVSRGLGKGLVASLLQQPSTTIIAAVRDPTTKASQALLDLPKSADSKLIIVKLDSANESDAFAAVNTLKTDHGITSVDTVIANAGISHSGTSISQTTTAATLDHFSINAIAPVTLFQATADLLKASSTGRPAFIAISSVIGSIAGMDQMKSFPAAMSPYGASKAALNWFMRRLHFEEPWLTSFVFHPGLVTTDMGLAGLESIGIPPEAVGAISVDESVTNMLKFIESATSETSGTFRNHDGSILPW
ncbi:hypothetical protein ABOM_002706 [Aspergillus bombycis]|uniref:Short-chain dehydrogenase n=1 Tax=Aspergillus bombycis TaxID=109264 RepID=A0A1F8A9E8_9EURO|nr:hypothetical protein ABOM_002706 [Aspergillus bombycis]OGM47985.1 hypothetical protein ABOM_002706 [Aspergillus bombycis]